MKKAIRAGIVHLKTGKITHKTTDKKDVEKLKNRALKNKFLMPFCFKHYDYNIFAIESYMSDINTPVHATYPLRQLYYLYLLQNAKNNFEKAQNTLDMYNKTMEHCLASFDKDDTDEKKIVKFVFANNCLQYINGDVQHHQLNVSTYAESVTKYTDLM